MLDPNTTHTFTDSGAEPSSAAISFVVKRAHPKRVTGIAYHSKAMRHCVTLATQYARSSAPVMILGESGTGKELFSRLVHQKSNRASNAFVAVNCAAIHDQLLESEFFGHEQGAFTGASQKRTGYFERAHGGTLLLDEVSEIPIALQAKLLRVIEEKEVQPVGSDCAKQVDVRIVATSNRNLIEAVEAGQFRRDLYHRLNVLELSVPPLRARKSDIPLLTTHFVEMFQHESKDGRVQISKEAMKQLCDYSWPGNVRELRNAIHRGCVVAENGNFIPHLQPENETEKQDLEIDWAEMPLADVERKMIVACLQKFDWNKKSAAEVLGVTPRTLSNKLKQYRAEGFAIKK